MTLWRGREMDWDPARESAEQQRQRWIIETKINDNLVTRNYPDEYAAHRDAFIETGDEEQLRLMLEFVHD